MNGAESLVSTLVACGVEVCFTNPGTSEMHFVAALDKVAGMRAILGLFEGAVTGMADGYGRMKEKPAATLLHLGPGLANGLANLHNARRAATPIVNIVGDHATYHAQYDAPLASDIVGFARPVSAWVHTSMSPKTIASDGARAVQAARMAPGQIATLILPADTAWLEADRAAQPLPNIEAAPVSDAAIDDAAQRLAQRQAHGDPHARHGVESGGPRSRRTHQGEIRRAADVRYVCAEARARCGPRGRRTHSLFRGTDRRIPERRRAIDPGRRQAARVVLRLSGQTQLVRAGRLPDPLSGAAA